MTGQAPDTHSFNLREASAHDYACLNAFKNVLRLEVFPDDPPVPYKEDLMRLQAMPKLIQDVSWAAWDATHERIIAFAEAFIYHTGDNPHMMECHIETLPACRRQGLARRMLRLVAAHARHQQRTLLVTECSERVSASGKFLHRIGARRGLELPVNQMRLADLEPGLLDRWMQRAAHLSSEFTLGLWDEAYPEERMAQLAHLLQVAGNDSPRDSLEMEDQNFTTESIRQFDGMQRAGGRTRWTMYAIHKKDDRLAAMSEVLWSPSRPAILAQYFTGVLPEYRGRGLGRWVKAAMLHKVIRERPEVQVVRSNNANSNAPMLKINRALGFKPYLASAVWQVELDSVEKYLEASR